MAAYEKTHSEAATLSESVLKYADLVRSSAETASLTEGTLKEADQYRSTNETATATEVYETYLTDKTTKAETATATDTVSLEVTYVRSATETASTTEATNKAADQVRSTTLNADAIDYHYADKATRSKYTYSVISDFPNSKVNALRLSNEIRQSSIVTALDFVNVNSDETCDIWFKNVLSGGDISTLGDVVAAHSGEPCCAVDHPTAQDGKPYYTPEVFTLGTIMQIAGFGDHATNGRLQGDQFALGSDEEGSSNIEFQYNDWVEVAGAFVTVKGADLLDWAQMEMIVPATAVTENPGGTGNCNVNYYKITPANNNGAYDVTLAEANPVPNAATFGYYEWSWPDTGKGTMIKGVAGKSHYDLYTVPLTLTLHARISLLGDIPVFPVHIPSVSPQKVLPHWKFKGTLYNAGHAGLKVAWNFSISRKVTT